MSAFDVIPTPYRIVAMVGLLVIVTGGSAGLAWQIQAWRFGRQLAEQASSQTETLSRMTLAAAAQQRLEQDKRQALEQRLAASDQTYTQAMNDAQRDQGRLRDRLATADLRLSVLLDPRDASGCAMPAATGAGGVDHGPARARLEPAHAQRIIAITDAGDRGLIALQACQAYVKALRP